MTAPRRDVADPGVQRAVSQIESEPEPSVLPTYTGLFVGSTMVLLYMLDNHVLYTVT